MLDSVKPSSLFKCVVQSSTIHADPKPKSSMAIKVDILKISGKQSKTPILLCISNPNLDDKVSGKQKRKQKTFRDFINTFLICMWDDCFVRLKWLLVLFYICNLFSGLSNKSYSMNKTTLYFWGLKTQNHFTWLCPAPNSAVPHKDMFGSISTNSNIYE